MSFPIKMVMFHSYVSLPKGNSLVFLFGFDPNDSPVLPCSIAVQLGSLQLHIGRFHLASETQDLLNPLNHGPVEIMTYLADAIKTKKYITMTCGDRLGKSA